MHERAWSHACCMTHMWRPEDNRDVVLFLPGNLRIGSCQQVYMADDFTCWIPHQPPIFWILLNFYLLKFYVLIFCLIFIFASKFMWSIVVYSSGSGLIWIFVGNADLLGWLRNIGVFFLKFLEEFFSKSFEKTYDSEERMSLKFIHVRQCRWYVVFKSC